MTIEALVVFVALCSAARPGTPPRRLTGPAPTLRVAVPGSVRRWQRWRGDRRARSRVRARLPLVLELVARELRSGVTMSQAIAAAATGDDIGLGEVEARVDDGQRLADAIDQWLAAIEPADAALVGGVFHLGIETGAATADALDRVAAALRSRRELAHEISALTAQSRASAVLVATAPLAFLLVLGSTDPASLRFLFATPAGLVCLFAGALLDAVGFVWMHRLVVRIAP